jgi:hypothetical protein
MNASPMTQPKDQPVLLRVLCKGRISYFRAIDLQRLGGTGKTVSELHKSLFPGVGFATVYDREMTYLVSKGATTGTRNDRWRKVLGTPVGITISQAIRNLAALP